MAKIIDGVEAIANEIIKQKEYLNSLDKAIADGDHGTNMTRGFSTIVERMTSLRDPSAKEMLEFMGKTLVTTVGGAAGPLYGNAMMAAAAVCPEDAPLNVETIDTLLAAAISSIQKRGRSQAGDKTMLDVLIPVHQCFTPENAAGKTLIQCLEAAVKAARNGVIYTTTIPARKGKASYIGEVSVGHEDPGAVSSMIMTKALYDFVCH